MSSLDGLLGSATTSGHYKLLRVLGSGGEGTVFLIMDKVTRDKLVVKRFHEPRPANGSRGLAIYARGVTPNRVGLAPIQLLVNSDQIEGLYYRWTPLSRIQPRVLAAWDRTRQSMIGAFCRMQYYLMSQLEIGLWDVGEIHFQLDKQGNWHYIDFGWGVTPLNHPECLDFGFYGYGFAMLLLSLFGINIKLILLPSPHYQNDQPCKYWRLNEFDVLAKDHTWVLDLVSEVRHCPASVFLEPGFYHNIGEGFPDHVELPSVAILASRLIRWAGIPRRALRRP